MFKVDPSAPDVTPKNDLNDQAAKATIIATKLSMVGLIITIVSVLITVGFGYVAYKISKDTYILSIETTKDRQQLNRLDDIIKSVTVEDSLLREQSTVLNNQLREISSQSQSMQQGIQISSLQLNTLKYENDLRKKVNLGHLYMTCNLLRDSIESHVISNDKTINLPHYLIIFIDSLLKSEVLNTALLQSHTLNSKLHDLMEHVYNGINKDDFVNTEEEVKENWVNDLLKDADAFIDQLEKTNSLDDLLYGATIYKYGY